MRRLLLSLLFFGSWLLGSALFYWWGRVLLPEVGLTAPNYWTWFWASLPIIFSVLCGTLLAALFGEVNR